MSLRRARRLSRAERSLAAALALVFLLGGAVAAFGGAGRSAWGVAACAALGVPYGVAWLRVAVLGRLLSARELLMPWQRDR